MPFFYWSNMNEIAALTGKAFNFAGLEIHQVRLSQLDNWVIYADPIREAMRDGANESEVFEQSAVEVLTLISIVCVGEFAKLSDDELKEVWRAVVLVNEPYFKEPKPPKEIKKRGEPQQTWFDVMQHLIGAGHRHADILNYTYGAFIGYAKAAGKWYKDQAALGANCTRMAMHGNDSKYTNFISKLGKD
jgi:hypothetical protein